MGKYPSLFQLPPKLALSIRNFLSIKELSQKLDWRLSLLLAMPFILIIFNPHWLFSYIFRGEVDPMIYFGYFLDLKQHLKTFSKTYFASRLPWILPGFLSYQFLSPILATYVLFLARYYASTISLYLILKQTLNRRIALLTTLLMGSYYYFLEPMGSHYIDGAGIAYLLLTLLMLTNTTHLKLCFAGIFFGCLIYTQIFLIIYIPLLILYYFYFQKRREYLPFLFGFICLTLFLCTLNYCLNGRFVFFINSIRFAENLTSNPNVCWSSLSAWWKQATWLLFPSLTLIASLITLACRRGQFFQLFFIGTFLLHISFQFMVHQPVLQLNFYASYMIPAMFLAIGSLASIILRKANRTVSILLILPIIGISHLVLHRSQALFPTTSKQNFLALVDGMAAVKSIDRKAKFLFWYNIDEPLGYLYKSLASTNGWMSNLVNEKFPEIEIPKNDARLFAHRNHIFVLSNDQEDEKKALQSLEKIGLRGEISDETTIYRKAVKYKITHFKLFPSGE